MHDWPFGAQVDAPMAQVPPVHASVPQQSVPVAHAPPISLQPHMPPAQMAEQHEAAEEHAVPSAAHVGAAHVDPVHTSAPQQSALVLQDPPEAAQVHVFAVGSHARPAQQSDDAAQLSPLAAQPHVPAVPQTMPPQHCPSRVHPWPRTAQAQRPAVHTLEQHSEALVHDAPFAVHIEPGITSTTHVSDVSSQISSPQQSSSEAQTLPVPAHGGVQTPDAQKSEQHWPLVVQALPLSVQTSEAPPSALPPSGPAGPAAGPAQEPKLHPSEQQSAKRAHEAPAGLHWLAPPHVPLAHWPSQHWFSLVHAVPVAWHVGGGAVQAPPLQPPLQQSVAF